MMKRWWMAIILVLAAAASTTGRDLPVAANGVALFPGYEQWRVIAPSVRPDKEQVRVILGNDAAFQAFQAGKRPFPDGAVLAKVAWTTRKHERFPVALVPDRFAQVEFMVKDAVKYKNSGGWGFARFVGDELKPYGKDGGFVQECFGCHLPMADNDYVFTAVPTRP